MSEGYTEVVSAFNANQQIVSELILTGVEARGSLPVNEHLELDANLTICTTHSQHAVDETLHGLDC